MNAWRVVCPPITRSYLTQALLVIYLTSGLINYAVGDVLEAGPSSIQFIVIGDWGSTGVEGQKLVAAQMNELASHKPIDFIVSTGDNFYPKGVNSIDDSLWQSTFENIYSLPALKNIPWYVTLGNHDYMGNIDAQINYASSHGNWILPQTYHSKEFDPGGEFSVHLLFLDTNPFLEKYRARPNYYRRIELQDTAAQHKWMKKTLEGSNARWKIVFGHHPVYSSGYHGDTQSLKKVLLPLFEKHNVQAYFAGHDHHLEHYPLVSRTHYFISGAGSRTRRVAKNRHSEFLASSLGFAHVSLDSACMRVRFINAEGLQLYQSYIPANREKNCP